jgi:pimeloyl-ACP methyl ester carboxylesterase
VRDRLRAPGECALGGVCSPPASLGYDGSERPLPREPVPRSCLPLFAVVLLGVTAPAGSAAAPRAVVLVANSSGDFRTTSAALCRAVEETGAPLSVETFVWTLGFGRYVLDHVVHANQQYQGRLLAARVLEYRRCCPGLAVHLMGHSAGAAVVLAAAELLPPGSVDRIVLLAPSVSCGYDLRPALRCAREGIDSYYSPRDVFTLGLAMALVGTADRRWEAAAGRVGFCPIVEGAQDAALYAKLRQHGWSPSVEWTGHRGLHFGGNHVDFTSYYLLPLLVAGPPTVCARPAAGVAVRLLPPERE